MNKSGSMRLEIDGIREVVVGDRTFLEIPGDALRQASALAVRHCVQPGEACDVLISGSRGKHVLTPGEDEAWIAAGVRDAYRDLGATTTMVTPTSEHGAHDTPSSPPAQIEIRQEVHGGVQGYELGFLVTQDCQLRGRLFQETKATLNPESWSGFLRSILPPVLRDAPRPFRVNLAVGGTSAENALSVAARADRAEFDDLDGIGDDSGRPIRVREIEQELLEMIPELVEGNAEAACSDVRVIRLVRHGGSLPIGLYVGYPDDRLVRLTLTREGAHLHSLGRSTLAHSNQREGSR